MSQNRMTEHALRAMLKSGSEAPAPACLLAPKFENF
jgi:hypothetical protein